MYSISLISYVCICAVHVHTYICGYTYTRTVEHSYNKPEIPGQSVCYKQEFVISGQFPMRYCSTWLRSLLCYTYQELCYREVCYKSAPLYIQCIVLCRPRIPTVQSIVPSAHSLLSCTYVHTCGSAVLMCLC